MRIFLALSICFDFFKLWNHSLLVCGHELWRDEVYVRRYDHYHGKYSDSELMVDVINNLGLNILMVHNEDNDNNIAFSPYGAGVILIALGEGLQGEALYEIRRTLKLPYDAHTIRVGLRDIHRHLKSYFIPREGFLAGITLNTENVSIKPKYIELLRFYGYDINSFNTALYPETHMTTEMTTMVGREETTATVDDKPETTPSITASSQETTTDIEKNTKPEITTSELQLTVSTISGVEKTTLLSVVPMSTTETVKTTVTAETIAVTQLSTNLDSENFSTSEFPEVPASSSQPSTDNIITTPTAITSALHSGTNPISENVITSTTKNVETTITTQQNVLTSKSQEIPGTPSIPSTDDITRSTTITSTSVPQSGTNSMSDNSITSTTENVETTPTTVVTQSSTTIILENFSTSESSEITETPSKPSTEDTITMPTTIISVPQTDTTFNSENVITLVTENVETTVTAQTMVVTEPSINLNSETSLQSEFPQLTASSFQPSTASTDNVITTVHTTTSTTESSTISNSENVVTTILLQPVTNSDSEKIITSTTENYETTTIPFQESTNRAPQGIITPPTNEPETSDITIPSTIPEGTSEDAYSTQEYVTQPTSSEAGTVESFANGNTNISLTINNQSFLIPRPRSRTTNFTVNIEITTDSSDGTSEMIQSREARSIKHDMSYIIDSPNFATYNSTMSSGKEYSINETEFRIKHNLLHHRRNRSIGKFSQMESWRKLSSLKSPSKINEEISNSERKPEYQNRIVDEIETSNFRMIDYNNEISEPRYTTVLPNYVREFDREQVKNIDSIDNKTFDISNYEIEINNTIYITAEQYNSKLESKKGLKESSGRKTLTIRKPRSVEDYIIARQYDQPHHFRPSKPYVPQEPPYFLVDGKKESNLDFMTYDTVLPFLYVQDLGAVALAFPLDSDKYYLLLLLPLRNNGLNELVCNIRMQNIFKYIINNLELTHVKATIPSFNLKGRITLTNTLQRLGIKKIFEPRQADFTPMTDDENIYVTNIEQAVSVTIKNYMPFHKSQRYESHHYPEPVRFDVNRPFLYFVIDSEQQVILMAGKVVNPLNVRIK